MLSKFRCAGWFLILLSSSIPSNASILSSFLCFRHEQSEIDAWISFTDDLSKVVIVDQHYSAPSKSSCGAPEGDPISVVASVLMCLLWFLHVRQGK